MKGLYWRPMMYSMDECSQGGFMSFRDPEAQLNARVMHSRPGKGCIVRATGRAW